MNKVNAARDRWWASLSPEARDAFVAERKKRIAKAKARTRLVQECRQHNACIWCNEEKPLSEFSPHPTTTDGTINRCKICMAAHVRKRRLQKRIVDTVEPVAPPCIIETPKRKGILYTLRAWFGSSVAT